MITLEQYEEQTGSRLVFPSKVNAAYMVVTKQFELQKDLLQEWLNHILDTTSPAGHSVLWQLLGYPCRRCDDVAPHPMSCLPFEVIVEFLDDPRDLAAVLGSEFCMIQALRQKCNYFWKVILRNRFPAVADVYNSRKCFRSVWIDVLNGETVYLGVHERQLKRGFAMSIMPADVTWSKVNKNFHVSYTTGLPIVPTERVNMKDARFRFRKLICAPQEVWKTKLEDIEPGIKIAVQWKMLENGPFGWWFGDLVGFIWFDGDKVADIRFGHIVSASRWHRLLAPVHAEQVRESPSGGYTGGMIKLTPETAGWFTRFTPLEPMNLR